MQLYAIERYMRRKSSIIIPDNKPRPILPSKPINFKPINKKGICITLPKIFEEKKSPICIICYNEAEFIFIECGHFCVCKNCGSKMGVCPICRCKSKIQKVFISTE